MSLPPTTSPGYDLSSSEASVTSLLSSWQSSLSSIDVPELKTPSDSVISSIVRVVHTNQAGLVIVKIEQILESVLNDVNRCKVLKIPFCRRPTRLRDRTFQLEYRQNLPSFYDTTQVASVSRDFVSFPGRSEAETKLFTQVLSILQLCHKALLSGTLVTKRNIFYQHRELFRDQRVVDALVDDIAYTLGFGRDSLNIVASGVGVVCGHVSFIAVDGSCTSATSSENGLVIPSLRAIHELNLATCNWILVIEKEATFRTLAASRYWNDSIAGPGAIVTSKGYPTLVTRSFLNYISSASPHIPIYGLVDYDPHGIRIFRTYKYGSWSLEHEKDTRIPTLKWLGIQSGDLQQLNTAERQWSVLKDVLPLTEADRRTAVRILREVSGGRNHDSFTQKQCREVQTMLMLNIKAEIQAVDDHGDLTSWLDQKLYEVRTCE